MANYYTEFSFLLPLKSESNTQEAMVILKAYDDYIDHHNAALLADLPDDVARYIQTLAEDQDYLGCVYENQGQAIWFYTSDGIGPNMDILPEFIAFLLTRYDLDTIIHITMSSGCDKPVLEAFGGTQLLISRKQVDWANDASWYAQSMESMQKILRVDRETRHA